MDLAIGRIHCSSYIGGGSVGMGTFRISFKLSVGVAKKRHGNIPLAKIVNFLCDAINSIAMHYGRCYMEWATFWPVLMV
jgi:hypothetical protein